MQSDASLLAFADRLADEAAAVINGQFRAPMRIDDKGLAQQSENRVYDPVTQADRGAEKAMRALIEAELPADGIVGEEFGALRADAARVWVLDPIDGTRSFISGIPLWGTLIGLLRDGKPAIGLMAQPFIGERFAGDGRGAWYRGPLGARPLTTRECPALSDAVMFTTTPALFDATERPFYDAVERRVRLARYGTDCYGYCMLAAGQADLVIEAGLQPYDVVALVPIIEGAGGVITTWTGAPASEGGRIVASGDAKLHDEVLRDLARCPA